MTTSSPFVFRYFWTRESPTTTVDLVAVGEIRLWEEGLRARDRIPSSSRVWRSSPFETIMDRSPSTGDICNFYRLQKSQNCFPTYHKIHAWDAPLISRPFCTLYYWPWASLVVYSHGFPSWLVSLPGLHSQLEKFHLIFLGLLLFWIILCQIGGGILVDLGYFRCQPTIMSNSVIVSPLFTPWPNKVHDFPEKASPMQMRELLNPINAFWTISFPNVSNSFF